MSLNRLFFPSLDRHGARILGRVGFLTAFENRLCADVGGYTSYMARGGFRMESGADMHESVDVVEFIAGAEYAREAAARVARALNQEAVLLVVDGQAEFVSADVPAPVHVAEAAGI